MKVKQSAARAKEARKKSAARAKEARKKRSIRGSFSAGLQLIDCDSHEEIGP